MDVIELSGTPEAMGAAFGEAERGPIRGLYEARVANAIEQAAAYGGNTVGEGHLVRIAQASLPILEGYAPRGLAELRGIARGANLTLEQIWLMNALTDLRDIAAYGDIAAFAPPVDGEGCSSFLVSPAHSADGTGWAGQTWDLATSNMPFVRLVRRRPDEGPETFCLTTVGCLSLIGMNAEGIAVGTTNIRTLDAGPGVCYLDVIHQALAQPDLEAAAHAVSSAPRAGAHYFYVMDGEGRGAAFECSAKQHARVDVAEGAYTHCNHILDAEIGALEAQNTPVASSHHRQGRLAELLAQGRPTGADLRGFLADHEGGEKAICRHDYNGISSNGSMVMNPANRTVWAVHGPACEGTWTEHRVGAAS